MSEERKKLTEMTGLPAEVFAKSTDQIRVRHPERFRQIYANNMQLSLSTWDLALTFGEIAGEQEGKSVIEETTRVVMTREIAKVLANLLNTHIAAFEKQYGEIKIPFSKPDDTDPDKMQSAQGEPESDS